MIMIENIALTAYTVTAEEETEIVQAFCRHFELPFRKSAASKEIKGPVIRFDDSSLSYADYGVDIAPERVYIWGGWRSLPAAVEHFCTLLQGGADLTAADSFTGRIPLPQIPYRTKEELLTVLRYMQNDRRLLFGQHLAGVLDVVGLIEDYTKAVGQGPSILDFDMCGLRRYPRRIWSRAVAELVEFAASGGVITTMHHWLHPAHPESNSFRGDIGGYEGFEQVLTDGTPSHRVWMEELDRAGDFLTALNEAGVPVMYRPLHEVNCDWFWFCAGQGTHGFLSPDFIRRVWQYVYRYYTEQRGLRQLLWSYGPNVSDGVGMPSVDRYYPGDEWCDVVGFDWYTGGAYEFDGDTPDGRCYDLLIRHGKPFGFMEWGINGLLQAETQEEQEKKFNCAGYVDILRRFFAEGKNLAFAEVYGGSFGAPSWLGNGQALRESGYTVPLAEMPSLIRHILTGEENE